MKQYFFLKWADLHFSGEEILAAKAESLNTNLGRLVYLATIGSLVALAHVIIFALSLSESAGTAFQWRQGIIASHSVLFAVSLISGITVIIITKRNLSDKLMARAIPHFLFLFFLATGTVITGIDQLITNAITPFIIVCFFTAMIVIIPPAISAVYYTLAYTLFIVVIDHFQPFKDVLLSNYLNGLTSVTIAWFLSMVLWKNYVYNSRNDRLIRQQRAELEAHNQELSRVAHELRQVNKSRTRLFSIISHDLRGPLGNLNSLMRMIQRDELTDMEFRELLPEISSQTLLTSDLLENLLNWSKNNLDGITCHPEQFNIHGITADIIRLYEGQAGNKNLVLTNDTDPHHRVNADPGMISLVLRNLVSNAIKFSEKNGSISVSSKSKGAELEITVADSGTGIEATQIPLLFGEDHLSTRGTAGERGTGLGLMLSKEFIERNGGQIGVQSTPGLGSRFWFTVPAAVPVLN